MTPSHTSEASSQTSSIPDPDLWKSLHVNFSPALQALEPHIPELVQAMGKAASERTRKFLDRDLTEAELLTAKHDATRESTKASLQAFQSGCERHGIPHADFFKSVNVVSLHHFVAVAYRLNKDYYGNENPDPSGIDIASYLEKELRSEPGLDSRRDRVLSMIPRNYEKSRGNIRFCVGDEALAMLMLVHAARKDADESIRHFSDNPHEITPSNVRDKNNNETALRRSLSTWVVCSTDFHLRSFESGYNIDPEKSSCAYAQTIRPIMDHMADIQQAQYELQLTSDAQSIQAEGRELRQPGSIAATAFNEAASDSSPTPDISTKGTMTLLERCKKRFEELGATSDAEAIYQHLGAMRDNNSSLKLTSIDGPPSFVPGLSPRNSKLNMQIDAESPLKDLREPEKPANKSLHERIIAFLPPNIDG